MKTKFLNFTSILFIALLFGQTINAQTNREETDLYQSVFGMEKKAIVADFIGVESSNPFWGLYDEYETKRKELVRRRLGALVNYVENYDSLENAQYDEVVTDMISLRNKTDKLMDQYYKKIKKASGSVHFL